MEKQFSIREALKTGWSLIKNENLFLLIGLILGYLVLYGILYTFQMISPGTVVGYASMLIQLFLGIVFSMGFIKICLQIQSDEEPEFAAFKDVIPLFFKFFLAYLLVMLPVMISYFIFLAGMVMSVVSDPAIAPLPQMQAFAVFADYAKYHTEFQVVGGVLLIPSLYLCIRFMFYPYLIVDRNLGAMESLRKSWIITKGNIWHLILLLIVFVGLIILGVLAFVIGIFIVYPLLIMAQVIIYKKLVARIDFVEEQQSVPVTTVL